MEPPLTHIVVVDILLLFDENSNTGRAACSIKLMEPAVTQSAIISR